jgi:small GTP-binding protein
VSQSLSAITKSPPPESRVSKLKVVIVGARDVGKTSLLDRWTCYYFSLDTTCDSCHYYCNITRIIDGDIVTVQIWTTPGREIYRALSRSSLKGASGVFLVFDVTGRRRFESLSFWLAAVRGDCPPDTIVVVIGNKIDLVDRREVTESEGAAFARENS